MSQSHALAPRRLDRLGIALSGICAIHCLATLTLVVTLGVGGSVLLHPAIHRVGLAVALVLGIAAIGAGFLRHRRRQPLSIGAVGLTLMGLALATGHGPLEAVLTVAGVTLVAVAHGLNLRNLSR